MLQCVLLVTVDRHLPFLNILLFSFICLTWFDLINANANLFTFKFKKVFCQIRIIYFQLVVRSFFRFHLAHMSNCNSYFNDLARQNQPNMSYTLYALSTHISLLTVLNKHSPIAMHETKSENKNVKVL